MDGVVYFTDMSVFNEIMAMIEYKNVNLYAGGRELLRDVSFSVQKRESVVLTGASGSGKTSLLLSLMGGFPIRSGTILYNGESVDAGSVRRVRGDVAFVGQEPVMGGDTVRDALLLPFTFKAHRGAIPEDLELARVLGLLHLNERILARSCDLISGGEKQRIALARAVLLGKKVFLLDEVTSSLDPKSKGAVFELLADPHMTILSVSHDPDWVGRCDRSIDIIDGSVVENGHGISKPKKGAGDA